MTALDFPALEEFHSDTSVGLVYRMYQRCTATLPELRIMTGQGWLFRECGSVGKPWTIEAPALTELAGGIIATMTQCDSLVLTALERISGGTVIAQEKTLPALELPALTEISGGTVINDCASLTELSMPELSEVTGGVVVFNCGALTTLNAPSLRTLKKGTLFQSSGKDTLSLPHLEHLQGGIIADRCTTITTLELPALTEISGGTVISDCTALTRIGVPALREITGGNFCVHPGTCDLSRLRCFHPTPDYKALVAVRGEDPQRDFIFPALESYGAAYCYLMEFAADCMGEYHVRVPALQSALNGTFRIESTLAHVHLHVGKGPEGRDLPVNSKWAYGNTERNRQCHLHVAPGFRSGLSAASTFAGTTRDELLEIIGNLADNTGHAPLDLAFGAPLLSLLTDDEIALATAKNYTLK